MHLGFLRRATRASAAAPVSSPPRQAAREHWQGGAGPVGGAGEVGAGEGGGGGEKEAWEEAAAADEEEVVCEQGGT